MSGARTPTSSTKGIKISEETRRLYENRDKRLDRTRINEILRERMDAERK